MAGDRAISLEEIKTQSVNLERMPVEEVLEQLKCTRAGLTSEEGARRLQAFGPNKLEEKKESKILKFFGSYVEPFVMGHGSCCYHGYCHGKWGWETTKLAGICWYRYVVADQLHH
ncbi:hypothetical protein SLA2020_312130 [Shorea laevis]